MSAAPRGCWQLAARRQLLPVLQRRRPLQRACAQVSHCNDKYEAVAEKHAILTKVSGKVKLRLDHFLTSEVPEATRGKLQASIKAGYVTVNGKQEFKVSSMVRPGDDVGYILMGPPVQHATPEDIPIDIVFEDDHVLVVNKAAGMVVHPGAGNWTGTLVNAFLHHCNLPTVTVDPDTDDDASADADAEADADIDDEEPGSDGDGEDAAPNGSSHKSYQHRPHPMRPGVVHRLDKGTTGLLVMAKDQRSLLHLQAQFKARSVQRTYQSITLGCPSPAAGQVSSNIGRDSADRKKMAAFTLGSSRGRHAVSGYRLLQPLGDGLAALVEWQLQTGRTHQIRVHAKKMGHPLFGDDAYGGAGGNAVSAIGKGRSPREAVVHKALKDLNRPALHAQTLGFDHPVSGDRLQFTSELPADFQQALLQLDKL